MILGGKKLGFVGGQYQNFMRRPHNDYWLSIAQAFFPSGTNLQEALQSELFIQNGASYTGPIAGLWNAPTP